MANQLEFRAICVKKVFDNKIDFKMYAMDVNFTLYPNLKKTEYGNICISGNLHELIPKQEYYITAIEKESKKGN